MDDCDGENITATEDALVTYICDNVDPDCCMSSWSNHCANLAKEACNEEGFDTCNDPDC